MPCCAHNVVHLPCWSAPVYMHSCLQHPSSCWNPQGLQTLPHATTCRSCPLWLVRHLTTSNHLQALADRDAKVASLRQELDHASSGAGETSDEVIRLKAELESSHQVFQGCPSGLCLLALVLQSTRWPFCRTQRLLPFKPARQPFEGCCTCLRTVLHQVPWGCGHGS